MSLALPQTRLNLPARNFLALAACLALGQGALFVAQTGLVLHGALGLLAAFGLHFSGAVLLILIVDWGGATVLARQAALRENLWRGFIAMSVFRLSVALVLCGAALAYGALSGDPFARAYALYAAPALLIWAFNLTGILDGARLGGWAGAAGLPPYLLSALALVFAPELPLQSAGALLGGALTLGYAAAVFVQAWALRRAGLRPQGAQPTRREIGALARAGSAALLTVIPGQIFFRVQLLIAAMLLGAAGVALLYYAMQLTAGVGQLVGFARRVEFPGLVAALRGDGDTLNTIARTQRAGTALALALSLTLATAAGGTMLFGPLSLHAAAAAVLWFAATVFSIGSMMALVQGAHALGWHGAAARALIGGVCVGIALSLVLPPALGLAGFALAALASHLVSGLWLARRIGRAP